MQYATGDPNLGLGKLLAREGRSPNADYRWRRIGEFVKPNTQRILSHCRSNGLARIFLTYGSEVDDYSDLPPHMRTLCEQTNNRAGTREHEIIDTLKPLPGERVLNKVTLSAFTSTPIELVLRTHGIATLLFAGVSTNVCVEHTLRDAADRGFGCVLLEDACGADSDVMHRASCVVVQRLYGAVMSTEEAIRRLGTNAAATEQATHLP